MLSWCLTQKRWHEGSFYKCVCMCVCARTLQVYTLGGARGPSLSYYVPYMSALQLFTPASAKVSSVAGLMHYVDHAPYRHRHHRRVSEQRRPFVHVTAQLHLCSIASLLCSWVRALYALEPCAISTETNRVSVRCKVLHAGVNMMYAFRCVRVGARDAAAVRVRRGHMAQAHAHAL